MVRSKRTSRAFIAANTFGTLGYISLIFQWAWTGLILAYPIITQAKRDDLWLFSPSRQKTNITPIQPADFGAVMPIISVLAIAFAAILIVMSIVAVIRLPKKRRQNRRQTHAKCRGRHRSYRGAHRKRAKSQAQTLVVSNYRRVEMRLHSARSGAAAVRAPDWAGHFPDNLGSRHVLLRVHYGLLANPIHHRARWARVAKQNLVIKLLAA